MPWPKKYATFISRFLDEWFHRFGREFIAHYPDYYMPYGITLSEDEIGAVSARCSHDFFLPELVTFPNVMGRSASTAARTPGTNGPISTVPKLRLLNLNQPGAVLRQAAGYFAGTWPSGRSPGWPGLYRTGRRACKQPDGL